MSLVDKLAFGSLGGLLGLSLVFLLGGYEGITVTSAGVQAATVLLVNQVRQGVYGDAALGAPTLREMRVSGALLRVTGAAGGQAPPLAAVATGPGGVVVRMAVEVTSERTAAALVGGLSAAQWRILLAAKTCAIRVSLRGRVAVFVCSPK